MRFGMQYKGQRNYAAVRLGLLIRVYLGAHQAVVDRK